jgi:hypothetical protein
VRRYAEKAASSRRTPRASPPAIQLSLKQKLTFLIKTSKMITFGIKASPPKKPWIFGMACVTNPTFIPKIRGWQFQQFSLPTAHCRLTYRQRSIWTLCVYRMPPML